MDGNEWLAALPEQPGSVRNKMILEAVESATAYCEWVPIVSEFAGNKAIFYVSDDAVRVDLDDGSRFRVPVTATLAQQCADVLEAGFITAKVSDLAYQQADVVLSCVTLPSDSKMDTTSRSKLYNEKIETKRSGRTGLIRDCGKAWILSNWLGRAKNQAVNYGFYDKTALYRNPSGIKMWQTLGSKHNRFHVDYSQTLILMKQICEVNESSMNVSDLMKHPNLHPLISNEGIIRYTRQPM